MGRGSGQGVMITLLTRWGVKRLAYLEQSERYPERREDSMLSLLIDHHCIQTALHGREGEQGRRG